MSTIESLFDALDESRERLLVAIDPLDDEALLQRHVVGSWSVADTLTNITAWEAELVTGLMRLDQKKKPAKLLAALADPAAYDAAQAGDMQDRDLDQVFEDLQLVRIQLEDWLSGFSERDLSKPGRFSSLGGRSLQEIVEAATIKRELAFLPAIEAYARTWAEAEEEMLPGNMIPLASVDPWPQNGENDDTD